MRGGPLLPGVLAPGAGSAPGPVRSSVPVVSVVGVESPLALYRRYRPETFAEVIGQDHVTEPLRSALAHNRVHHAYLFSGPRGCGKTTSARILARTLNCELAPVPDPCGECQSCRDLARGGPGSIDVIEIDAASHGGVDDARDLREKAFFAPVRSRYKVYVIDEAHMVTTQGFNALLKLVEEPPPHLRFIFATTEPDKVLPTIRSRTHHYPFRLIPPRLLTTYLGELCDREGVEIEPAAIPLVVRAGGGSARDTLSVLDQLLGGAGPGGVTHALATGLLGYTPDTLLDEAVDAFAAGDGAAVFGVVDKVVETGQDPRRFTEDLLRRLRDLVIVAAVPDAPATGLIDVSDDQGERLVAQAARFGVADLSRAADLVATGLTEMRGATAPRLLLELVCARVLLPGADHATQGVMARLDRLERRNAISGTPSAAAPTGSAAPRITADPSLRVPAQDRPAPARPQAREATAPPAAEPTAPAATPAPATPPVPARPPAPATPPAPGAPAPAVEREEPSAPAVREVPRLVGEQPAPEAPPAARSAPGGPAPTSGAAALSLVEVRRLWPDVVEATGRRRRLTWIHLSQNSQVVAVGEGAVTLGFANAGARESFEASGSAEIVRQAVIDVVGVDWRVESIVDPGAEAAAPAAPRVPLAPAEVAAPEASPAPGPTDGTGAAAAGDPGTSGPAPTAPDDEPPPEAEEPAAADDPPWRRPDVPAPPERPRSAADLAAADAEARPDDPAADVDALAGADLLARELGARTIEEIRHQ